MDSITSPLDQVDPLDQIAEALTRDDTVLFIGAGVSHCSGLPLWNELVENLIRLPNLFFPQWPSDKEDW